MLQQRIHIKTPVKSHKINIFALLNFTMSMRPTLIRLLFLLGMFSAVSAKAQRLSLAFVDSDYILSRMPEYQSAQQQLNESAVQWEKEALDMETALLQMQRDYSAEEILLTGEQRKERKSSIEQQEKKLISFREEKFGMEGALFKKRAQLVKPIQDKMFDAVQNVAKAQGLDYIFDKASGVQMLYANPRHDKTFEVMEELGIPLSENEMKNESKKENK
jgi:outer membrane protein